MPNHLHGIVLIRRRRCRGAWPRALSNGNPLGSQAKSLSSFIGGFKAATTTKINKIRQTPKAPLWQRNYHEHIIDNLRELNRCRKYIHDNPSNWHKDPNNSLQGILQSLHNNF
jgi:putative transposase